MGIVLADEDPCRVSSPNSDTDSCVGLPGCAAVGCSSAESYTTELERLGVSALQHSLYLAQTCQQSCRLCRARVLLAALLMNSLQQV